MRDPKRIDRMMALLLDYWKKNPDMRLAQIVVNAAGNSEPFHIEDDLVEQGLNNGVERLKPFTKEEEAEYDEAVPNLIAYFAEVRKKERWESILIDVMIVGGCIIALVGGVGIIWLIKGAF